MQEGVLKQLPQCMAGVYLCRGPLEYIQSICMKMIPRRSEGAGILSRQYLLVDRVILQRLDVE